MSSLRSLLSFFGVRTGELHNEELIAAGRRRAVLCSLLLSFVLVVSSCSAESWVEGGLEYSFPASQVASAPTSSIFRKVQSACPGGCFLGLVGDSIKVRFELGLSQVSQDTASIYPYTEESFERDCNYQLAPFLRYVNAASASNQTSNNIWAGIEPIDSGRFSATLGLLGFSAFLMLTSYILLLGVQYEVGVLLNPKALWVVRVSLLFATFFILVAVLAFGASNIRASFCQAFDPDAQYLSLPCGYGPGFDTAIAALIFTFATAVLSGGFMTLELPSPHFSSSASSSSSSTADGSAAAFVSGYSGYNSSSAEAVAATPESSGKKKSKSSAAMDADASPYSSSFASSDKSSYQPIGTDGGYQS